MTNPHVEYNVYLNMRLAMKHRGAELNDEQPLDQIAFRNAVATTGFVAFHGVRAADDVRGAATVVFIFAVARSKVLNKKDSVTKMLATVMNPVPTEIVIVHDAEIRPKIWAKFESYKAEKGLGDLRFEVHRSTAFATDAPHHELVPPHSIASKEEVDEFCRCKYTARQYFARIPESDPQAAWLGARAGMVIRVDRKSETAGIAVVYRLVTPAVIAK